MSTASRRRRILVVEDEPVLAGTVVNYLARDGFDARAVHTGPEAIPAVRDWEPDVVILDIGLPGLDGLEVCRQLRGFSTCYIIMLTARADEEDTLQGLTQGADDYMTKPFSVRELVARVQAQLRRPRQGDGAAGRVFGSLAVDSPARRVTVQGGDVDLTPIEFNLLDALSARPGEALSRRHLIDVVWGRHWVGDEQIVDVHVRNLRRKLGDSAAHPRWIITVRGHGYRMGEGA